MKPYLIFLMAFAIIPSVLKVKPKDTTTVVYVCKDMERRLFFMGEDRYYRDFLKRGSSKSSCRSQKISTHKWNLLRVHRWNRLKKRRQRFSLPL